MSSNPLEAAYAEWVANPTAEYLNDLAAATHSYALRYARRYSGLDTDELAQQATIAVWESLGQYDPKRCSIAAWVSTIIKHQAMSYYRNNQRTGTKKVPVFFVLLFAGIGSWQLIFH